MVAIERAVKGLQEITDMAIAGDSELESWGRIFNAATKDVSIVQNVVETDLKDGSKQKSRQERPCSTEKLIR